MPGFQTNAPLIICLVINKFNVTKRHVMGVFVDMARNLGIVVKQTIFFCILLARLLLSSCFTIACNFTIAYKTTVGVADFEVYYAPFPDKRTQGNFSRVTSRSI